MRCTDVSNKLSYHTAHASREILAQEAETMDVCIQALEDRDGKDAYNVNENIDINDEGSERDYERAQT